MDADKDTMKGRVEKAAGELTDDDELRRRGRLHEAAGKAKEAVRTGKDKLEDAIEGVENRLDRD